MDDLTPDLKLVEEIQLEKQVDVALDELIERHSGIYVDMVNSYFSRNSISQPKREILEEKDYNIYMAALKYDPSRGTKFSTHLGNETKWICLNYFNKNKTKYSREVEYKDELQACFPVESPNLEREDLIERIFCLVDGHPDPRVKQIFTLRYITGEGNKVMAWERVSQQVNVSIQGCINVHNKAVRKIQSQLEEI